MKKVFIFIFVLLLGEISSQTPNNAYITPDLHGENLSGLFLESPLTLQYHQLLDSHGIQQITAYKRAWNEATMAWGDTIAAFKQQVEQLPGFTSATETRWLKKQEAFIPTQKTVVFNRVNWRWNLKNSPDSTFFYTWDTGVNEWVLTKKIVYKKLNSYVYERCVFLNSNTVADSIWYYQINYPGQLTSYRQHRTNTGNTYETTDSLDYYYINYDTLCTSYTHRKKIDNSFQRYRRYDYTHFSAYDSYRVKVFRNYDNASFIFLCQYEKIVDLQHFSIGTSKDTFILNVPYLPAVHGSSFQYDTQWIPLNGFVEYRHSASPNPDSILRYTFSRNIAYNIVDKIDQEIRYQVNTEYKNQSQWLFAFEDLPVHTEIANSPLSKTIFSILGIDSSNRCAVLGNNTKNQQYILKVFNSQGGQLLQTPFTEPTFCFSVDNWPPGVYVAMLESSGKQLTAKQFFVF